MSCVVKILLKSWFFLGLAPDDSEVITFMFLTVVISYSTQCCVNLPATGLEPSENSALIDACATSHTIILPL